MNFTALNSTFPIVSVLIFSPLVAAVIVACLRREALLRVATLVFTLICAAISLPLYWQFNPSTAEFQFTEHAAWIPWMKINWAVGLDGISLLLVLLTTLIMPLCVLCSWQYIQSRVKEFMVCLLLMESAMIGVFAALDLVLFFVFWEAMLIPMALLIGIWGGPRKIYAALKFFIYTMAGSVLLLVAIIALFLTTGTFSIPDLMGRGLSPSFQCWVFLAFALSFAIKVPMFPFHTWLPAAHVEAPTAGSVLLASVLLKMGTYGFLRFCLPITPHAVHVFMPWMLGLSVVAILYGGFTALGQSDLKKLVAYSSVAHMGFATLGIFVLNQVGIEGSLLVMINHGVTTGALFIAVGMIYERLHTRDLEQTAGLGKFMPIFAGFLGVFALSSLAFPGTNSFIGEFLVLTGGFSWAQRLAESWSTRLMILVVPGIILAAAYNLRMLQRVAYGGTHNPDHSNLKDLGLREVLTLAPLFAFVLWIGLHPAPFTRVLHASVEKLVKQVGVKDALRASVPTPSALGSLSPKGCNSSAQGNALGTWGLEDLSRHERAKLGIVTPFHDLNRLVVYEPRALPWADEWLHLRCDERTSDDDRASDNLESSNTAAPDSLSNLVVQGYCGRTCPKAPHPSLSPRRGFPIGAGSLQTNAVLNFARVPPGAEYNRRYNQPSTSTRIPSPWGEGRVRGIVD
jgi:NADH-quinone oxidoreductase subunit M